MILNEDLARAFRLKIIQAVFGEDWRPDKPVENIGAGLDTLLQGRDLKGYPYRAGHIQGMLAALKMFDEVRKEINALPGETV